MLNDAGAPARLHKRPAGEAAFCAKPVAADGVRGYDTALFVKPDLIVTDMGMPAADGIHVVRRVRDTESLEKTPILVTTAFGDGCATFSLQLGANAFEPKPIDPHSLLATVERLLAERETLKVA